jgi:N-acetylglucosaminyl-diphospho-decaprenol L-rhamnosyltransferase
MARVAIVIVTYNSACEIGPCLDALAHIEDIQTVVIDNASSDDTSAEVNRRGVRLIANSDNKGFAAAVNQGVRATSAPYVLLLNPDAQLQRGSASIAALLKPLEDPRTAATGGMLIGSDGKPQIGFMARNLPTPATLILELLGINRLWPRNPVNWHYRCLGKPGACEVEQPAGAFLMFSRSGYLTAGGFDERFYPVWFEDVDFCAKLKASGYRVCFVPDAVAIHTGGHSVGRLSVEIRQRYWYGSLLEYASKYYRPISVRAICFAVVLGAGFRALPGLMSGSWGGRKKVLKGYCAVVRLAFNRYL